jgi:hypothetical protein
VLLRCSHRHGSMTPSLNTAQEEQLTAGLKPFGWTLRIQNPGLMMSDAR